MPKGGEKTSGSGKNDLMFSHVAYRTIPRTQLNILLLYFYDNLVKLQSRAEDMYRKEERGKIEREGKVRRR